MEAWLDPKGLKAVISPLSVDFRDTVSPFPPSQGIPAPSSEYWRDAGMVSFVQESRKRRRIAVTERTRLEGASGGHQVCISFPTIPFDPSIHVVAYRHVELTQFFPAPKRISLEFLLPLKM